MNGDSRQLRILKAITTHLEGITPANGYDYDLAGRVARGRTNFGADEAVPFVSILESLRPDPRPDFAGSEKLLREEKWELLVQGWATVDRQYPTDALYGLKASVEMRLAQIIGVSQGIILFPAVYRLGGLISGMQIGPGVVKAATPGVGGIEAFYLPLLVSYAINMADPYA